MSELENVFFHEHKNHKILAHLDQTVWFSATSEVWGWSALRRCDTELR